VKLFHSDVLSLTKLVASLTSLLATSLSLVKTSLQIEDLKHHKFYSKIKFSLAIEKADRSAYRLFQKKGVVKYG